jgi:hypothetical protein
VGGKAYLTGPYKGAPFGVAVIVPAIAGPFDLGTVVIRQALYLDRNDAHATDVSDPFPTILQGIPLRIKSVKVTLDRPEFMFNPTSCEHKAVSATVTSIGGAHAPVSSRFQAAGCRSLPFAPKLTASAAGKASKPKGTTFAVDVTSAGLGQASIAKVALTLPKALPSRLTTIQKACPAAVFEANPATCDEGSVIGMARIHTPLLANPLSGPAYLVSHAAASFPDVEFVLQGEGVTPSSSTARRTSKRGSPTRALNRPRTRRSRGLKRCCPRARTRRSPPTCRNPNTSACARRTLRCRPKSPARTAR